MDLSNPQAETQTVHFFMIKAKYIWYEYDSYVYFKQNDHPVYLLLYMDDMLIAVRNKT